ncbi:MAG: hypothetical protein N2170_05385 [Bacteroidia bacterium]|nr:hypothetical protein [Bacteroidia bacterium]
MIGGVIYSQPARKREYYQAQVYTQRHKWDSALMHWRGLLWTEKDSSRRALIYHQLGYIALHRRDSVEALRLWEQSLRLRPDYPITLQNYQWLRLKLTVPPPPAPTHLYRYEAPPPLSEKNPPHLGEEEPQQPIRVRWFCVVRLQE